jgi:hypothetical protein
MLMDGCDIWCSSMTSSQGLWAVARRDFYRPSFARLQQSQRNQLGGRPECHLRGSASLAAASSDWSAIWGLLPPQQAHLNRIMETWAILNLDMSET